MASSMERDSSAEWLMGAALHAAARMRWRLYGLGLREVLKLRPVLHSVYGLLHTDDVTRSALLESVAALERAVNTKPREWVFWYKLGDYYLRISELARAVRAYERCYELRSKDVRGAYALATTLMRVVARAMSVAEYLGHPAPWEVEEDFSPAQSRQALRELGMTVDQAAERSLFLLEEVLRAGVRGAQANHVRRCIAWMRVGWPQLEQRVKATQKAPKGLPAESSTSLFNQAVEHQAKLRYLTDQPLKFRQEVLEIVRLCQLSVAKQPWRGDAYVLLANALVLAAHQSSFANDEAYDYFLTRAAAVIHHWATSDAHTYNKAVGTQFLDSIRREVQRVKALTPAELEQRMDLYCSTLLRDALGPNSLDAMRQMLIPPVS